MMLVPVTAQKERPAYQQAGCVDKLHLPASGEMDVNEEELLHEANKSKCKSMDTQDHKAEMGPGKYLLPVEAYLGGPRPKHPRVHNDNDEVVIREKGDLCSAPLHPFLQDSSRCIGPVAYCSPPHSTPATSRHSLISKSNSNHHSHSYRKCHNNHHSNSASASTLGPTFSLWCLSPGTLPRPQLPAATPKALFRAG